MKKPKLRKNGYRFLKKILPFMNEICPWCGKFLDIEGLKMYVDYMGNRNGGKYKIKRSKIDVDIDHKKPVWLGGTNEIDNIQLMHPKCNNEKGGREPRDYFQSPLVQEKVINKLN